MVGQKKTVRLFTFLMAVVLVLGLFSVPAMAVEGEQGENLPVTNHSVINLVIDNWSRTSPLTWEQLVTLRTVGKDLGAFTLPLIEDLAPIEQGDVVTQAEAIISLLAMGEDPENHQGRNLVEELLHWVNENAQQPLTANPFEGMRIFHALRGAGVTSGIDTEVLTSLLSMQTASGAFDIWGFDWPSEEDTALMIVVLQGFYDTDPRVPQAIENAFAYLRAAQDPQSGGFLSAWGDGSIGGETTSHVIQAIVANGNCVLTWAIEGDTSLTPAHAMLGFVGETGVIVPGVMPEQIWLGLASIGLEQCIFVNLRNPIQWPEIVLIAPEEEGGGGDNNTGGGNNGGGNIVIPSTVFVSVTDPGRNAPLFSGNVSIGTNETAYSVLQRTGLSVQARNTPMGRYVYAIAGITEFSGGAGSGWVFRINGTFPGGPSDLANVVAGDRVEWLFTRDLGQDVGGGGDGGNFTPPQPPPSLPQEDPFPFTDVAEDAWYYDYVNFVWEEAFMNGVSENQFAPSETLSRAMVVTVLHRIAGELEVVAEHGFTDVLADRWYTDAIAWAYEMGIVQGLGDGTFAPNRNVSREELATMLFRYANTVDPDTNVGAWAQEFADVGEISTWAKEALQWANGNGFIRGVSEDLINPRGTATRAEKAAIITRFVQQ